VFLLAIVVQPVTHTIPVVCEDVWNTAVLVFGDRPVMRPLTGLPLVRIDGPADIDAAIGKFRRLVVVGEDADLAAVLARLLRADRLDIEVGYVPRRCSAAARVYGLRAGRRAARRARRGRARLMPLIRDETGAVIVGGAVWRGAEGPLHGEAVVDDTTLFDGDVAGVRVEPTAVLPGLRARVLGAWPRRWVAGRAAQLGCTGVVVTRDGVPAGRPARRSTFYRHTRGWLLVR